MRQDELDKLKESVSSFVLCTVDAYDRTGQHYWKYVIEGHTKKWAEFVDARKLPNKLVGIGDTIAEAVEDVHFKWRELVEAYGEPF